MHGPLENPRHEAFARYLAAGHMSATQAYALTYQQSPSKNAGNSASRLLENVGIQNRINELQTKSTEETVLTLARKRAILREIGEGERPSKLVKLPGGKQIKTFEPVKALELDAKLAGELDQRTDNGGVVNIQLIQLNLDSGAKPVSISDKNETISVESMPSADDSTFSKKVKS